jgi:signal transduction histidine kinase
VFAFEPSRTEEALQLLTRRLLHAQEDERRTVARELHDGLNQTLAMLGVEVGIAMNQLPASAKSVRQQLQRILLRVEQVTEEVREISHRLHPALLEHLGLVSALRSYCSEFEQYRELDVLFVCEDSADQIPFDVAVCLYRIVQEALCNAAKHANAREVVVRLSLGNGEIKLSVSDDGRGFDVIQPRQNTGLGLISMEERARIIGGRFSIDSHMGAGTRIEVVVPAKEASKWELLSEISSQAS